MLEKLKSRGLIISALAFVAMVVVFIATFQGMQTADTVAVNRPAPALATTPAPAPSVAPTPAAAPAAIDSGESEAATTVVAETPRIVTYADAEAAYLDRRYDDAVRLFTAYTDQKGTNPWGFYMLGLSSWKAGDNERAEAAFEQSLSLDATHVKSYVNLSRVLLEEDRAEEAFVKIDDALDLDRDNADALRVLGRTLQQLGKNDDAIAAYREAIRHDDQDAWSMNNMALILIEEGRYDEALPPLARAVEIRDDVAVFYNNLGMALERNGYFHAAVDAYSTAVDIDAAYEHASTNLARASTVLEEPGLAPVDLAASARAFVDEVATWSNTDVASERVQTDALPAVAATVEPDSTAGTE